MRKTRLQLLEDMYRVGLVWRNTPIVDDDFQEMRDRFDGAMSKIEKGYYDSAPKVVCLCGSTKFIDVFDREMLRLTEQGNIVLTVGTHGTGARDRADNKHGNKSMLDELHKRKIDLADSIFVLNVGGYIGSSTRGEIEYAIKRDKSIAYLEPLEKGE